MARHYLFSKNRIAAEQARKEAARKAAETRAQNRAARDPELEKLKDELRDLQRKVSQRSRRLRAYEDRTGNTSPALDELRTSGGPLRVQNTKVWLRNEIMRGRKFMNDPTSTVKGSKEYFDGIAGYEDRWEIYKRLRKRDPSIDTLKGRFTDVMDLIDQYIVQGKYSQHEIDALMAVQLGIQTDKEQELVDSMQEFEDDDDDSEDLENDFDFGEFWDPAWE